MEVATHLWTREARDHWQRISTHAFENSDIALDFTQRLARTLGWPTETARAGIEEYRRFCFLAVVTTGAPVTPSEEIDEIWHLHLTYTRDYWDRWCGGVLGRRLHHDPTEGGPTEASRFRAQYADTLALYEAYFGPPPATFWPGTAKRFATRPRYQVLDRDRSIAVPRPSLRGLRTAAVPGLAGLFALVTTSAAAEDVFNPLDLAGPPFLMLFICLAAVGTLASMILRDLVRKTGHPANLHGLSPVATAYLTGGMTRAADALFLALAAQDAASHTDKQITIGPAPRQQLPLELERFRSALQGTRSRQQMIGDFKSSMPTRAMLDALQGRNVVLAPDRQDTLRLITALPMGLVLCLGLAKIFVGLSRDRPVGFLVTLCIIGTIALLIALGRDRCLTKEGSEALAALRTRCDRVIRAPRTDEIALAFALGGAAALAGTEHAAYAKLVKTQGSSGSGCSGSGCGGGGGGGCGGCGS